MLSSFLFEDCKFKQIITYNINYTIMTLKTKTILVNDNIQQVSV